ncbi:hypothetical protein SAMN05216388_10703 [Halorientalis persicus]|uniref:Uncharacterized protein n=1 Tax=Halorientalis persicus TaxID=1367881 RepID=A0A1H8WQG3_9EURY|nr:hypothetical protein [Halorientalis persicus]SEP29872.1 hypothetical protein SAMN05216388_10703 [Halorientalis persicus]
MSQDTREVTTLLCNQTESPKEGDYRVINPQNDEIAASSPFIFDGSRTETVTETMQNDRCREFTNELKPEKTYTFVIELQSGSTSSENWTVSNQSTLQINIQSGNIEFKELTNSPT